MLWIGLLPVVALTPQVIAAPHGIDQPVLPDTGKLAAGDLILLVCAMVAAGFILARRWYRLRRTPHRPRIFLPHIALVLMLAMLALGMISGAIGARLLGIEMIDADGHLIPIMLRDQVRLQLCFYAGEGIVLAIYLRAFLRAHPPSPDGRRRPERAAFIGAIALAVTWPVVMLAGGLAATIIELMTGIVPKPIAHDTLQLILDSPRDVWALAMIVLVVFATPIFEEVLYRGLLQDALRGLGVGPWPAIILTSIVFALMHWQNTAPHAVIALFTLSLAFGWAFERTGRLTASITMHALFNAANLAIALFVQH